MYTKLSGKFYFGDAKLYKNKSIILLESMLKQQQLYFEYLN
jgi:hypothetical protein